MKRSSKILANVIIATTTYSLIGCAAPQGYSYKNVSILITQTCSDCQIGAATQPYNPQQPGVVLMSNQGEAGTTAFTANVTNAPEQVTWQIYPLPNLTETSGPLPTGTVLPVGENGSQVGSFNAVSGNTAYYTQGGIPVYSGAALQQAQNFQYTISYLTTTVVAGQTQLIQVNTPTVGIPQGDVLLAATVQTDPSNPNSTFTGYQLVQVYNGSSSGAPSVYLVPKTPTTPAGLTDSVAFVPHNGGTFQFYGGAVGAAPCASTSACLINGTQFPINGTDNGVIWEVGTSTSTVVAGGNSTVGTISNTGLYTAPTTIPSTGAQVVVVMAAHALTTTNAVAYVTIQ